MTDQCGDCRFNRSSIENIIVDGRIADQFYDWGCAKESEFTDADVEAINAGKCPYWARCTAEELKE